MKKGKKSLSEKLIYNNKFVMLVSVALAVIIWATVKINYSTDITRVVSDVRISLNTSMSDEAGYRFFVNEEQLYVDVEISGKAYDVNSNVIDKEDIIVTAPGALSDYAGNKELSLNARIEGGRGNAQIVSVIPSKITVFYDREVTETFNVEAKLTDDTETLVGENYIFSELRVSGSKTIDITGPESVISKIETVYLTATVDESMKPLEKSVLLEPQIEYKLKEPVETSYLRWLSVEDELPKVNVVVKEIKNVPTAIKYINNPSDYKPGDENVTIDPSNVIILGSAESNVSQYLVHTIDFSELSNKKNEFVFSVDEVQSKEMLSDKNIKEFKVTIDFSNLTRKSFNPDACEIIYVGGDGAYDYTPDFSGFENEEIIVIGPRDSVSKISAKDIKIEIDVENLQQARNGSRIVKVTNISIQGEPQKDCWVYGSYEATVTASAKPAELADASVVS